MRSENNTRTFSERKIIVMARPTKYTPERVDAILAAIRNGDSNKVAAARGGINLDTFYTWLKENGEFSESIKEARREYENWEMEGILRDARKSLKTLILGETYEETRTEYEQDPRDPGKPRIKKQITTTKKIMPNATAVIFALVNRDPEHWQNRMTQELNAKVNTDGEVDVRASLARVPDDLLDQVLQAISESE